MNSYGLIDLHCDTLAEYWKYAHTGNPDTLDDPGRVLSLSNMPKDVHWAQFYAVFIPDEERGQAAIDYFEKNRANFDRQMEKFGDRVAPCRNADDMEKAWAAGKTAAFLTIENGSALAGDLSRVHTLAEQGVRAITLTWNGENELGSGHTTDHGMSEFGKAAVREMEKENILVDVSHLNDPGFADLLEVATKPFVATHSNARAGQFYKYRIYGPDGSVTEHCDPYGFAMELRPACCSIITDLEEYRFTDEAWMADRTASPDAPLSIYEMHLGSWMRNPDDANGWYTYDEIARRLIPYLQENGYTHVEFLPLSEHPFDGSWGYQNTGFFAPTSRYGTPAQLKLLIDKLHHAGIGAIMDFVPVHFAVDSYGLAKYDGTHLYEYPHSAVGESEWGSYNFIHSRREVRCFLQSAADYWLTEFHFDGLRMDAVSRLIYWQGDPARGVNGDTLEFLKNMNRGLKARHPSALLIAEDSTAYPGVTRPVDEGGLGFDYKWDLGWMHDTLEFCQTQPDLRPRDHGKLLWSMHYFSNEHYLLPLSHDEVVHGKAAIVQKMWGADECDKYAQARVMYLYMFTHPGKKLNFMGNELGQLYEWSEAGTLDWALAERPFHRFFHSLCITYVENPALHADYASDNFRWAENHADALCVFGMERRANGETLLALCNFADSEQKFTAFLPKFTILLDSNAAEFGGTGETLAVSRKDSLCTVALPRYSAVLLKL